MASDDTTVGHWDAAYSAGDTNRSWYQPHAQASVEAIQAVGTVSDTVIDVGGGASTLVDDLLDAGYRELTVLDVSNEGMQIARDRLGQRSDHVRWLVEDITTWRADQVFDLWHDRAVLHFLTTALQQSAYREAMLQATHPGSTVVIGVFGPNGPPQCSGLDVVHFDETKIKQLLGPDFAIISQERREHTTPSGNAQEFLWTSATRIR